LFAFLHQTGGFGAKMHQIGGLSDINERINSLSLSQLSAYFSKNNG